MIEIALATTEDYPEPPVYRSRAYVVKKDGRVIGIGGLSFPKGLPVFMWSTITDDLRALPVTLHKIGKRVVSDAQGMGVRVMYATTDEGFPAADRWIKRLGFAFTGEVKDGKKVHVWHAL